MSKKTGTLAIILLIFMNAYADENPAVTKGAEKYDWQSCVDARASDCINDCSTSENIDCSDNCTSLAKDKCLSEGYSPPN